ncbi:MAG: efflux transporter periplasmic adaptor subunit [Acidiferrobacteraceae bacterium]|nr:efflux transporter periplasmic adaptor subunit [Acidiferrobacteraceae bacterium]
MRRLIKWLIVILVITAVIVLLYWQSTKPRPVIVAVTQASQGIVENTIANTRAGTIEACKRAQLSPSTSGLISVLNIAKGDLVKKGDLLMSLWNNDIMAEMELARAEALSARANARASCLTADSSARESKRLLKLKKSGAVSEETVDRAVTDASARKASCDAAQASTTIAAARVNLIKARLDRTRLVAPFDGIVGSINGELYEYVTPTMGGAPAVDLIDTTCFYVTAPIDEVDAPRVAVGQPARVTLDAFGDREFAGIVNRIAPYVLDIASKARTVEIEVELTNISDISELLAGYSADVEVILARRDTPVRVPSETVLEGERVFILSGNTIEERIVTTGLSNWSWTEIIDGVAPGESVITSIDTEGVEDGALASTEPTD